MAVWVVSGLDTRIDQTNESDAYAYNAAQEIWTIARKRTICLVGGTGKSNDTQFVRYNQRKLYDHCSPTRRPTGYRVDRGRHRRRLCVEQSIAGGRVAEADRRYPCRSERHRHP